MTLVDDYSRKLWVFILKNKSGALAYFKQWKVLIENQTGRKIKRLRTDNGLDFCSEEFDTFCKEEKVARHRIIAGTP